MQYTPNAWIVCRRKGKSEHVTGIGVAHCIRSGWARFRIRRHYITRREGKIMDKFTRDMVAAIDRNHQLRMFADRLSAISARRKPSRGRR